MTQSTAPNPTVKPRTAGRHKIETSSLETHGVNGFLDDRQRLIVQIMKLTSAIDARHHDIVEALTIRFCQQMVDYLSNGHFQIYSDLFPTTQAITSKREYLDLDATTQIGMRFNDQFAGQRRINFDILKTCLDELTLALETRFELEDELITQHNATLQMSA